MCDLFVVFIDCNFNTQRQLFPFVTPSMLADMYLGIAAPTLEYVPSMSYLSMVSRNRIDKEIFLLQSVITWIHWLKWKYRGPMMFPMRRSSILHHSCISDKMSYYTHVVCAWILIVRFGIIGVFQCTVFSVCTLLSYIIHCYLSYHIATFIKQSALLFPKLYFHRNVILSHKGSLENGVVALLVLDFEFWLFVEAKVRIPSLDA